MVRPGEPVSFPSTYAVVDPDDVQIEVVLSATDDRDIRETFASPATVAKQIRPEPVALQNGLGWAYGPDCSSPRAAPNNSKWRMSWSR